MQRPLVPKRSTTQTLHEDDPAHFGTLERIDTFHFRKVIEQE